MNPRLARFVGGGTLALALIVFSPSVPQRVSPCGPVARRVPALDGKPIQYWCGVGRVVAMVPEGRVFPRILLDLDSGRAWPRPHPPLPPDRGDVTYGYSDSIPSPDGKKWLHIQLRLTVRRSHGREVLDATGERFVVQDAQGRLCYVPSDGSFRGMPRDGFASTCRWLADSSGWMAICPDGTRLYRYELSRPDRPRLLAHSDREPMYEPETPTAAGYVAFGGKDRWTWRTYSLDAKEAPRSLRLRVPVQASVDEAVFAPSGRFVLMLLTVCAPQQELWRIPTDGGAARRLWVADQPLERLSLAPDSRTLIYWTDGYQQAYETTVE